MIPCPRVLLKTDCSSGEGTETARCAGNDTVLLQGLSRRMDVKTLLTSRFGEVVLPVTARR